MLALIGIELVQSLLGRCHPNRQQLTQVTGAE